MFRVNVIEGMHTSTELFIPASGTCAVKTSISSHGEAHNELLVNDCTSRSNTKTPMNRMMPYTDTRVIQLSPIMSAVWKCDPSMMVPSTSITLSPGDDSLYLFGGHSTVD